MEYKLNDLVDFMQNGNLIPLLHKKESQFGKTLCKTGIRFLFCIEAEFILLDNFCGRGHKAFPISAM